MQRSNIPDQCKTRLNELSCRSLMFGWIDTIYIASQHAASWMLVYARIACAAAARQCWIWHCSCSWGCMVSRLRRATEIVPTASSKPCIQLRSQAKLQSPFNARMCNFLIAVQVKLRSAFKNITVIWFGLYRDQTLPLQASRSYPDRSDQPASMDAHNGQDQVGTIKIF